MTLNATEPFIDWLLALPGAPAVNPFTPDAEGRRFQWPAARQQPAGQYQPSLRGAMRSNAARNLRSCNSPASRRVAAHDRFIARRRHSDVGDPSAESVLPHMWPSNGKNHLPKQDTKTEQPA
jgi:hypothetical protein